MKKILFVALAATLLAAGCQKTEVINRVGDRIGFTSEMGKLTKAADPVGLQTLQNKGFKVWAYAAFEDPINEVTAGDLYDEMAGLDVTYNGQSTLSNKWETPGEYYWPGVDKNLAFFAVSTGKTWATTQNSAGVSVDFKKDGTQVVVSEGNRELTVNGYTVDKNAPNDDLMVADFVLQNQGQNDRTVNMTFRHALSKIEFLFKTVENPTKDVYVKSVTVSGIKTAGTLTVSEKAKIEERFVWAPSGEGEPFTTTAPAAAATDGEGGTDGTTSTTENLTFLLDKDPEVFATWMIIPQEFASKGTDDALTGLTVTVAYKMGERNFESTFPLYTADLLQWLPNQYVRYTVTLAPNLISFNPTVEGWDQYDAVDDVEGNSATTGNQDITMQN